MNPIKKNMTRKEFREWKISWFQRIPQCEDFHCCHETMNCAVHPLCGCGSIYNTYIKQEDPQECTMVDCCDCMRKYDCKKINKLVNDSMKHNYELMKKLAEM